MRDRKGNLDDIYRLHSKALYYYLLRLSGSPNIAEDLVQETFYKATISLNLYKHENVKAWLFKVARHSYIDEWRRKKRWNWFPFIDALNNEGEIISPYGQPEIELFQKEKKEDLYEAIKLLPESYRSIIYLREFEDFTYEELAESLEMNQGQVKVTLYRARQKLKELLIENFDERGNYDD